MNTRASLLNRHNRSYLALLLLLALLPAIAAAQERITLVVSLRDVAGAGIPQARVIVRDSEGVKELAQVTTDSDGQAIVLDLPNRALRIAVVGSLLDGTPLHQTGQDALGVLLFPDGATTRLDLRSERDGAVIPDPVTMIAPDLAAVPALDSSAGISVEPAPILVVPSTTLVARRAPATPSSSSSFSGWGLALLAVLLVAVIVLLLVWRRI